METTNSLEILDLEKIQIGNSNPRKTFDTKSLQELSESIKSKGVLQPILVRPKGEGYELICGERRYKASVMAELDKIPASIRNLSDDEAFEAQIVENLERKDVHPLEEADAFQRMLDSKRYTIADISAKMAKSEVFITHRLKLTSLIDEIKQDFFNDKIGIGHAVLIARLTPEAQKEILEYSKHGFGATEGYGTINQLRRKIDQGLYDLKDAAFNIKDEKLIPSVGSCINCHKRSGANPVLFADVEEENKCFDASCFGAKMESHIYSKAEKILTSGKDVFLLTGYSSQKLDDKLSSLIKEYKVPVLKEYDDFSTYVNGSSKKAKGFFISGRDAGKSKTIHLRQKGLSDALPEAADSVKEEISKIQDRAKRALELDREKVTTGIHEHILSSGDHKLFHGGPLHEFEKAALVMMMLCKVNDKWEEETFGIKGYDYRLLESYEKVKEKLTEENFHETLRRWLLSEITSSNEHDREKFGKAKALYDILGIYHPEELTKIEQELQEKADKRIARTKKRLSDLKEKK